MTDATTAAIAPRDAFHGPPKIAFDDMADHLQRLLNGTRRGLRAGSILKMEGDDCSSVYLVLSGWIALSKSLADGARQIIDIVLPGGIIDPSSADGATSAVQIEALSHAKVAVLPEATWASLRASEPDLQQFDTITLAATLSRMSERMLRLGKGSAETRLAYALIELCMRVAAAGTRRGGAMPGARSDCAYHLPLTQQMLGEYVGLSSVHVCRTMRRFARNNLISMADHMDIVIHDIDALAAIAGVEPDALHRQIIPESRAAGAA